MEPIAITIEEACKLCSMGRDAMVKLMQHPQFPVFKTGNKSLIPYQGLRKFIETLGAQHYNVI